MDRRSLPILALLALVSVVYVIAVERHRLSTDEQLRRDARVLPEMSDDARLQAVDRIEINTPEHQIHLQRDGGWRVLKPVQEPADSEQVVRLLKRLAALERLNQSAPAPAEAGQDWRYSIRLLDGKQLLHALRIGHSTPDRTGFYFATRHDTGLAIGAGLLRQLAEGADTFRSKRLWSPEASPQALRISRGDTVVRLKHHGRQRWTIEAPFLDRASSRRIGQAIAAVAGASGERPATEAEAEHLRQPVAEVLLEGASGTQKLSIGKRLSDQRPQFVVRADSGPALTVHLPALELFLADAASWRAPALFDGDPKAVQRMELKQAEQQIVLQKQDGRWHVTQPELMRAEPLVVEELLAELFEAELGAPQKVSPEDLAAPSQATVAVYRNDDGVADHAVVGARDGDLDHAWALRYGWRFDASRLLVQTATAEPLHFRSRQLLAVPLPAVRLLLLTTDGTPHVARQVDGGWQVGAGGGWDAHWPPVDALRDLAVRLSALRAVRWLGELPATERAELGLESPRRMVGLELHDQTTPRRVELHIGAKVEDGYAAALSGEPSAFVISSSLVELIDRLQERPE